MTPSRNLLSALILPFAFVFVTGQYSSAAVQKEPVTEACLGCICEGVSDCNTALQCTGDVCGLFKITWAYWSDAGKPVISGENPNSAEAYPNCAKNAVCAAQTVINYMNRFAQDCNHDGQINCYDYASIHKLGGYGCSGLPADNPYYVKFDQCARLIYNQSVVPSYPNQPAYPSQPPTQFAEESQNFGQQVQNQPQPMYKPQPPHRPQRPQRPPHRPPPSYPQQPQQPYPPQQPFPQQPYPQQPPPQQPYPQQPPQQHPYPQQPPQQHPYPQQPPQQHPHPQQPYPEQPPQQHPYPQQPPQQPYPQPPQQYPQKPPQQVYPQQPPSYQPQKPPVGYPQPGQQPGGLSYGNALENLEAATPAVFVQSPSGSTDDLDGFVYPTQVSAYLAKDDSQPYDTSLIQPKFQYP